MALSLCTENVRKVITKAPLFFIPRLAVILVIKAL